MIKELASSGKDQLHGPVKVGAIFTIAPYLFPYMIPELKQHAQDMPLVIEEDLTENLRPKLRNGELDAIIVADAEGIVRAYNPAAEAIFGWTQAEIIGQPMAEMMIPAHHRAAHAAGMKRFLTTGERRIIGAGRVQMEACHKSGRRFPVEVSITHERVGGRHVFVSFLRDITHRLRAEADLRAARDEALAAARKKSEFLAIMSHEIRTPLNGILGAVDLLQATPLDEAQTRHVRTLRRSGDILLGHVNDVLDLTRLETGAETLRPRPMDLRAVFDRVLENQDGAARKAGNRMSALVAPDVPPSLLADDRRLSQVLLNLVGNANKFTSGGEIVLSACCLGVADGQARLVLSVADTGVGIPTGDRARIFEDFVMLDPSYDRNAQGTGLGLGIARRIVQAMGGSIDVRDSAGGGADFHIELTLPVADAPAAAPVVPDRDRAAVGPLSVLMVEDNPINREVLRAMLEQEGHRVTEAADGTAGVAAAATGRFDLILMDISMPGMNGTEAARAIREGGGPNAATPIVATTAHALPAEIESFRANGMPQTLTKPISRAALRALLAGYAPDEDTPDEAAPAADLLDPAHYAETWLRDAGLTRDRDADAFEDAYRAYLADFEARGVTGIGFGLVLVRRPAHGAPTLARFEELEGPVESLGAHLRDCLDAHDWLASVCDAELLDTAYVPAADVTREEYGRWGSQDPEHILIRQGGGFGRAVRADTALAGLMGASDGELTAGQIAHALAALLDVPAEEMVAGLVPAVRELVLTGMLLRA